MRLWERGIFVGCCVAVAAVAVAGVAVVAVGASCRCPPPPCLLGWAVGFWTPVASAVVADVVVAVVVAVSVVAAAVAVDVVVALRVLPSRTTNLGTRRVRAWAIEGRRQPGPSLGACVGADRTGCRGRQVREGARESEREGGGEVCNCVPLELSVRRRSQGAWLNDSSSSRSGSAKRQRDCSKIKSQKSTRQGQQQQQQFHTYLRGSLSLLKTFEKTGGKVVNGGLWPRVGVGLLVSGCSPHTGLSLASSW